MWLSSTIKSNITAKQKAFKKYKQSGRPATWKTVFKKEAHI